MRLIQLLVLNQGSGVAFSHISSVTFHLQQLEGGGGVFNDTDRVKECTPVALWNVPQSGLVRFVPSELDTG